MGIKFDHSQYCLDADMVLGAASNNITKQGPFTDYEFFRSLINPGFDGSLRYLMASCAALLTGSNYATSQINSSSNKLCGTGADDASIGTITWSNPTNIYADDTQYATAAFTDSMSVEISHYLKATNFGFSLPTGAIITGITAAAKGKLSVSSGISISSVRLLKAGTPVGTEKAGGSFAALEGVVSAGGGASDLWGTTLTKADVENANFGIMISCTQQANYTASTLSINDVEITVNYYIPAVPSVPSTVTYKWQARKIGQAWTDLLTGSLNIANTGSIADDIIKDMVTTTFDAIPIDFRLIMSCADTISVTATIGNTDIKTRLIGEST